VVERIVAEKMLAFFLEQREFSTARLQTS